MQIFAAAKKDMPTLEDDLAAGKFEPLKVRLSYRARSAAQGTWRRARLGPDPLHATHACVELPIPHYHDYLQQMHACTHAKLLHG